jgi:hypothetical protein
MLCKNANGLPDLAILLDGLVKGRCDVIDGCEAKCGDLGKLPQATLEDIE